jgi:hypothetical protein
MVTNNYCFHLLSTYNCTYWYLCQSWNQSARDIQRRLNFDFHLLSLDVAGGILHRFNPQLTEFTIVINLREVGRKYCQV